MIGGVEQSGGLAYEAMLAALKSQTEASMRLQAGAASPALAAAARPSGGTDFVGALGALVNNGVESVNAATSNVDRIVPDMVTGKIDDLHEVAMRINQADLTLRFSLEVRNKLIDAYREVMRMNV